MRKITFIIVSIFLLLLAGNTQSQVVPDSYRYQKQQEMANFKDSIHDAFVRYLEHLWAEYQLFTGDKSPRDLKPTEQPQIDKSEEEADTLKNDHQISYGRPLEIEGVETMAFLPPSPMTNLRMRDHTIQFYGRKLKISIPESVASITLSGINERQVARFWKKLADNHADQCLASLDQLRHSLYLNDWGLYDLVRHFSEAVFPNNPNQQTVLSVFILNIMHYDVRIGRIDNNLVMLLNTGIRLYNTPYVEIADKRYYACGCIPNKGRIYTYERQLKNADIPINMRIVNSPRLGGELTTHTFKHDIRNHKVSFQVNKPLIDFYAHYPQTELTIYANAAIEEALVAAIEREMRSLVEGQSAESALNILLEFMQQGFKYKTDLSQFQHEKNFFCEENFYYPANDCEDRAILFARIVKILLGYDVVLLEYKDHVATAVHIPGSKKRGQYLQIKGKRYMVCDPTYIGATIGQLSRKYHNKKANIIIVS